jgi:hypothetical protein
MPNTIYILTLLSWLQFLRDKHHKLHTLKNAKSLPQGHCAQHTSLQDLRIMTSPKV